jgi:hypothetical protein
MGNDDRMELTQWVEERMATLASPAGWEPNTDRARARFHLRVARQRAAGRYCLAATAAACLVCAMLAWTPGGRALAQALWRRIAVGRVEVVKVDFDSLPDEAKSLSMQPIQRPGPAQPVADPAEAARHAGFVPRLPAPGHLPGDPHLSVLGPMSFGTALKLADLQLALHKAGVMDEAPPKEWDGAQLAVQIGPTVNAAWSNDVGLIQGLPAVLSMPAGFDLGAFARMVLRAVGMNREAAQRFGGRLAAAPSLLLGIPDRDGAVIREVHLHTGTATLIEDLDDHGRVERVSVLWSAPDRVYILTGAISADMAIATADSVN